MNNCKLLIFILVSSLIACQGETNNTMKQETTNKVAPADSIYIRFDLEEMSEYRGALSIISPLEGQYAINTEKGSFTAYPFPPGSVLTMLSIPNESIYPIYAGDSVVVSYPNFYPYIEVPNSTRFTESEINFSTHLALQNNSIFEYFFKRIENQTSQTPEACYKSMLDAIDNALQNSTIGENYAEWIQREAEYAYYTLSLSGPFENNSISFINDLNRDEYLIYYHYRKFIAAFARKHLKKDYSVDDILLIADRYFNGQNRDFLIYHLTNQLLATEGDDRHIAKLLERVNDQFADTIYKNILSYRYAKVFDIESIDSTMEDPLLNPHGLVTTLEDVIASQDRKLIYLDFWASWCVPCRVEFPYAAMLKSKRTDVAFLYISIDSQQQPWLKAHREESLGDHSYLMPDSKKSAIIQRYSVQQIPRYFILDSSGKVLNENAPRPSDPQLENLFDEYLQLK